MTVDQSQVEEIVESSTTERLRVDTRYGDVVVVGWWDDLNPSPRRETVKQALNDVRKELQEKGFDVSRIESQYGQAKVTVRGRE